MTFTENSLEAKEFRDRFNLPRSPYTFVSKAALQYNVSQRIINLSKPKIRKDNHVRAEFSNVVYDITNSGVYNKAALSATSSERISELARPKSVPKDYVFAYPPARPVTASARKATASERILELSQPKKR